MYLCALAVAEPSAGTPAHVTVTNFGAATPFATVENSLLALGCPIASQKDMSEQVCESSERPLVFFPF